MVRPSNVSELMTPIAMTARIAIDTPSINQSDSRA